MNIDSELDNIKYDLERQIEGYESYSIHINHDRYCMTVYRKDKPAVSTGPWESIDLCIDQVIAGSNHV